MKETIQSILLFFGCSVAFAQQNYTVVYNHTFKIISFEKQKPLNDYDREECLYINGDSISFYSFQFQKPDKKDFTIGGKKDHHSVFNFLKLNRILSQNAWQKPYALQESQWNVFNWQVHTDTIRIAGYLCQVAVSDGVVAWFTKDIPVSSGPSYYYGLPGLILMIEDYTNKRLIKASSVKLEDPKIIIPKMKIKACKDCESKADEINNYFPN